MAYSTIPAPTEPQSVTVKIDVFSLLVGGIAGAVTSWFLSNRDDVVVTQQR